MPVARLRDHDGNAFNLELVLLGNATHALATSDLGGPTGQFGYQQFTDLSQGITLQTPEGASQVTICCENGNARYRLDGVMPTPTIGMPILEGSVVTFNGAEMRTIMVSQQTPGVILNAMWEG